MHHCLLTVVCLLYKSSSSSVLIRHSKMYTNSIPSSLVLFILGCVYSWLIDCSGAKISYVELNNGVDILLDVAPNRIKGNNNWNPVYNIEKLFTIFKPSLHYWNPVYNIEKLFTILKVWNPVHNIETQFTILNPS